MTVAVSNEYADKKVLVTGADGFIGSHLVERLVAEGAGVRALTYYNSWNSVGWLSQLPQQTLSRVEVVQGDIRDARLVAETVRGCAYVFHLSSLIGIPYSYRAPQSYVDTNVTGALNLLEACRHSDALIRLVHTSTSEVYGSAQTVPIAENHPLVGQSPYSASKIAADKLAESYHLSFGLPVVTARPFNTFGPRQTARAVIPTIISQLLTGADELKLGAMTPTRDFNFVLDTVAGLLLLGDCPQAVGDVVNIGTGQEWSVGETAAMLMDICDRQIPVTSEEERVRPADSEVDRLIADNRKIAQFVGWSPQYTFEQGLQETVRWSRDNLDLLGVGRYLV